MFRATSLSAACGELLFIRSARLPAQFCGPGLGIRPCDPALASAQSRPAKPTVALLLSRGSSTAPPSLYRILRAAVSPLAPASTVDHSPRPIPLQLTDQPNRLAPLQARPPALCSPRSAPRHLPSPLRASFAVPVNRRPLFPLQPSFSLRLSRPSPDPRSRQLPSALVRDPRPFIRAAHFPVARAEPPLHPSRASTARPFTFLLISCLSLFLSFRFAPTGKAGHHAHSANASVTQLPPHRPLPFPSTVVRPVMLCRRPAHRCNPR